MRSCSGTLPPSDGKRDGGATMKRTLCSTPTTRSSRCLETRSVASLVLRGRHAAPRQTRNDQRHEQWQQQQQQQQQQQLAQDAQGEVRYVSLLTRQPT